MFNWNGVKQSCKQLIIELYGDTICFTYPSNKYKSQMAFCTNSSSKTLVESLRVSPVQQVATNLAQEFKEYSFQQQESFCKPHDLKLSVDMFIKKPTSKMDRVLLLYFQGESTCLAEDWCNLSDSPLHLDWWQGTNTFPCHGGSSSARCDMIKTACDCS